MARLTYSIRTVEEPGLAPASVVDLAGAVDPQTLETLQQAFDELVASGAHRVILDLQNLKYINSTGMGMFVQYVDIFSEQGGGLALMNVQPKVLLVVEMLGLQELFQIVGSQTEALQALEGEAVGPANIAVQLEGQAPVEAPVPVESVPVEAPVSATGKDVPCQVCGVTLSVGGEGAYQCPRCRTLLEVSADGNIRFCPSQGESVELAFPCSAPYFAHAGAFIRQMAGSAGLADDSAAAVERATIGCLDVLAREALTGGAANEDVHLFAHVRDGRLVVRIFCGGQTLSSSASLAPYQNDVDNLTYAVHAGGNLVSLEKMLAA